MDKLLYSLFLIFFGLTSGYYFNKASILSKLNINISLKNLAKIIQKIVIMGIMPLPVFVSMWIADIRHNELFILPFLGAAALLLGGITAFIVSKPLGLNREQQGIFTVAGGFTNIGGIGGLVSFLLLGEKGFALVAIYQMFEKFIYFPIGFPFAKSRSSYHTEGKSKKGILLQTFKDPVITIYLAALGFGIALNLSGFERPHLFNYFSAVLIPIGSYLLLFSIGSSMKFAALFKYKLPGLFIFLIKSLVTPLIIFPLGYVMGLGNFSGGIALKLLLIMSSMPVAFIAIVPPTLYDMDVDLANTCWVFSTAGLIIVIPALYKLLPLI